MMTRQDFEKFAAALRDNQRKAIRNSDSAIETAFIQSIFDDLTTDIGDICESSNDAFDWGRFRMASRP